ncbi:MAG: hypothetical protein IPM69_04275 [Ignavibacteria bacterium]|nr:hypothetical protein [Ignavibacteria bacterium]
MYRHTAVHIQLILHHNTMIKIGLFVSLMMCILSLQSANAQRIEIGLSPVAGVWNVSQPGTKYGNAYSALIEFFKSDSSRIHFQIRYDYFESTDEDNGGIDNSFQNLGIGLTYGIVSMQEFQLVGFTCVGFLLMETEYMPSLPNSLMTIPIQKNMPSSTNLIVGISAQWRATKRLVPYIESSFLSSFKINANERTRVECFALRLGLRLKL